MKFLKIYGAMRTGTNYLEWLLRHNFPDDRVFPDNNIIGWKHGPIRERIDWTGSDWEDPQAPNRQFTIGQLVWIALPLRAQIQAAFNKREIIVFVTVRDPCDWYAALTSYLKQPVVPINKRLIGQWNQQYSHWLERTGQRPQRMQIVRYEDLVRDYVGFLESAARRFGLKMREPPVNTSQEVRPAQRVADAPFRPQKHQDRLLLIRDHHLNRFKAEINHELVAQLGYKL